jgi:hypothetical protein
MAADGYLPTATLIVEVNGQADQSWEFEVGPDAPLGDEELRDALVRAFLPHDNPAEFQLFRSGTAARPVFTLRKTPPVPFLNPRPGRRA